MNLPAVRMRFPPRARERITVFAWSGALGDTLMLVPALRALRRQWPRAIVHLLGSVEAGEVLRDAGLVDSVASAGDERLTPMATGNSSPQLETMLYDPQLLVVFTSRVVEAVAAVDSLACDYLVASPDPVPGRHAAEHLLLSLSPIGISSAWAGTEDIQSLVLSPASSSAAGDARDHAGRVLVHPGSGAVWKCAPAPMFAAVADRLKSAGRRVAVIEGPADEAHVAAMRWTGETVRAGRVAELARILASSHAVIGNDSGVTHLAALLGVPVVALFGPTLPQTWRPMGPHVGIVRTCTAPPGADLRVCDDPECMTAISARMVIDELKRIEASAKTAPVTRTR